MDSLDSEGTQWLCQDYIVSPLFSNLTVWSSLPVRERHSCSHTRQDQVVRMVSKGSALMLCVMVALAGCASARQLQQAGGQQGSVDIGGLVNQIGQVASQGIQSVLQNSDQGTQQAANSSRPLGNIGDALQNLGAQLNNRTTAASPNRGTAAGPAPAPKPDDGLLADPTEITATSNTTSGTKGGTSAGQGGLAGMLGNLTSGLANVTSGGQRQGQPTIQPPPGMGAKSAAGAVVSSSLAGFAAFVVLLLQLLA